MNTLESSSSAPPPSLPQALHSPVESSIGRLFADLPIVLHDAGIEHAFLRGIERNPARRPGADVDALVAPRDLARADAAVIAAGRELGARPWGLHCGAALGQLHLYGDDAGGAHEFLSIDLHALAAKLLAAFVPRPDATLVVTAPLAAVRARKQELTTAETARQLAAHERLAAHGGRFHLVRNEGPLVRSVMDAVHAVFPTRPRVEREGAAA